MERRKLFVALLVGAAALVPQVASANAGTPLMWAGILHLVFGNALIGLGEGLLIALVFKLPKWRCVGAMIAANYFSAWVGGLTLVNSIAAKFDWNLYTAWRLFWGFVGAAYLMTILLELPFIALCFWRQEKWLARSLKASLLAQTISYLCLFGWYWGASGKSLYTQLQIVPPAEIRLPDDLQLYYISARDGRVHLGPDILGNITSTNDNDRLMIKPLDERTNRWELVIRFYTPQKKNARIVTVLAPIESRLTSADPAEDYYADGRDTWFNFGDVFEMGGQSHGDWKIKTGFWSREGIRIENLKTGERFSLAWETVFSRWAARNAIQLPDGKVIFQLGDDQICALELATKKIALLYRGRGPAVVLK